VGIGPPHTARRGEDRSPDHHRSATTVELASRAFTTPDLSRSWRRPAGLTGSLPPLAAMVAHGSTLAVADRRP
jgi:hypothetical protein